MNDLEQHLANAIADLRTEAGAGVELTDQVIEDLAREHALNYLRDHGTLGYFVSGLKVARTHAQTYVLNTPCSLCGGNDRVLAEWAGSATAVYDNVCIDCRRQILAGNPPKPPIAPRRKR